MITVVGTGMERGDITARGKKAIAAADELYSRGKTYYKSVSLCEMFQGCVSYEQLDKKIADYLLCRSAEGKNVVFLSVGDGYSDTAIALAGKSEAIKVIPGVADCRARALGSSFTTLSAYDLPASMTVDTRLPLVVYQIDDRFVAGDVKLFLMKFYPEDCSVTLACGADTKEIVLEDLDRTDIKQGSSIYIAPVSDLTEKRRYGWNDLLFIMERLVAPDGCPWDKAQTHDSICINMLEEAYEAVDAIKNQDTANLREELGDVILQSVFHANMSEREGEFDINDVISDLCEKLVTRHTHIFGENRAANADEALVYWEKAKAKEKSYTSFCDQIDRIPDSFPGSIALQKFIKKANKNGAGVTSEYVRDKIGKYLASGTQEETKKVLSLAVMLVTLMGEDAEIVMLDEFRALKNKCREAGSAACVTENL